MRTVKEVLNYIKSFEGLKLEAYQCPAGIWTIGYGTTKGVIKGMKITKARAEELFLRDVQDAEDEVLEHTKVPLTDYQLSALTSFTYNLGEGKLIKSSLLSALNAGNYKLAANKFLDYCKARDKRTKKLVVLQGLKDRREAEKKIFETVQIPNSTLPAIYLDLDAKGFDIRDFEIPDELEMKKGS